VDRAELDSFWADVLGGDADRIGDESYANGFLCGALGAWDAAKPQLVR
jgi:hypothetical protein